MSSRRTARSIQMCGPLGTLRLSRRQCFLRQLKVGALAQSRAHGLRVMSLTDSHTTVANQKAKYMVKKLNKIVKDQEHTTPFEFHNQGSLAYLGDWCVIIISRPFSDNPDDWYRKAIYDRSTAETGIKAKESGRVAWLLWRSAYFTMTLSIRNKYVNISLSPNGSSFTFFIRILVPTYW